MQEEFHVAFVFISHDLEAVRVCADEIVVMYLGQIVERGTVEQVFDSPAHPYTQALIAASRFATDDFSLGPKGETDPTTGCRLMPRCPLAESACAAEQGLVLAGTSGRMVRCWKAVEDPVSHRLVASGAATAESPVPRLAVAIVSYTERRIGGTMVVQNGCRAIPARAFLD